MEKDAFIEYSKLYADYQSLMKKAEEYGSQLSIGQRALDQARLNRLVPKEMPKVPTAAEVAAVIQSCKSLFDDALQQFRNIPPDQRASVRPLNGFPNL